MFTSGEYTPYELGPERQSLSGPSDHEIVLEAAVRYLGDERYVGHHNTMLESLHEYDLATPGMETAVALHDIVDHGLINPNNGHAREEALAIIDGLYEKVSDKDGFLYSLGCAISASYWESEVGEGWRYAGPEAFDKRTVGERQQITAAIEHDKQVEIEEDVLKSAKPDQVKIDTGSLQHAMQERDVEGLIIKAVELLDNLDNPPPNNPASTWRDCVETIKCYSPALELFGFNKLANDLRGKALEYFYDEDPETVEKAQKQYDISSQHHQFVVDAAENVICEALRDVGGFEDLAKQSVIIERQKSKGSLMEKFHSKDYVNTEVVPDGIGLRVILPDSVTAEMIIEIGEKIKALFTDPFSTTESENGFLARHPVDDNPVDNSITKARESGYRAYHLALQQVIKEDGEESVIPLEIQLVTETQERLHTYEKASHVLYKSNTPADKQIIADLRQIELRAEHLRDKPLNRELNPHTWAEILKLTPNLKTALHESYSLIETEQARIILPHELSGLDPAIFEKAGLKGDIILPPSSLSIKNFYQLIGLIDPSLRNSEMITRAIMFVEEHDLKPRRSGKSTLEGHLLPVAFHAGALAALSSKHWDSENSSQYLETIMTKGLLHDTQEDTPITNQEIAEAFDKDVAGSVEAMSSPGHIKNTPKRRAFYAEKIAKHEDGPFLKLPDRSHNILTDMAKVAMGQVKTDVQRQEIIDYFKKTEKYLEPIFENPDLLPQEEYRNVYQAIKAIKQALL